MSVYGALPQGGWQRFFLSGITDLWAVFCKDLYGFSILVKCKGNLISCLDICHLWLI